jgi:hypothetical protein
MLELAITSPFIPKSSFQPQRTNADECFANYSKMEQQIGKGRVRGRWMEGVEDDFMF